MHDKELYVCLVMLSDKICLQTEGQNLIAFETEEEALGYWERGYEAAFKRGVCGTAGAMIGYIKYQPHVVHFNSYDELMSVCFNKPPYKNIKDLDVGGIICQKDVRDIFNDGIEPKLIEIE